MYLITFDHVWSFWSLLILFCHFVMIFWLWFYHVWSSLLIIVSLLILSGHLLWYCCYIFDKYWSFWSCLTMFDIVWSCLIMLDHCVMILCFVDNVWSCWSLLNILIIVYVVIMFDNYWSCWSLTIIVLWYCVFGHVWSCFIILWWYCVFVLIMFDHVWSLCYDIVCFW